MWSPGCISCSPDSVQQDNARNKLLSVPSRGVSIQFCICQSCHRGTCHFCIDAFVALIASKKDIPNDDASVVCLRDVKAAIDNNLNYVPLGLCCIFKKSMSLNSRRTLTKPPTAPPITEPKLDLIGYKHINKKHRRALKKSPDILPSTATFLLQYFDSNTTHCNLTKPPCLTTLMKKINKSRKPSKKYKPNVMQGALVFPEYNLAIQADATNYRLYCDHMALAESREDNTNGVMHGVPSAANCNEALEMVEKNELTLQHLQPSKERIELIVKAPEDPSKERLFKIDIITVDQLKSYHEVAHMKGMTNYEPFYLCQLSFFGHQDIESVSQLLYFFFAITAYISLILLSN